MFSYGLPHMDALVLANQQKLAFISSVQILDVKQEDFLSTMANRDGWWERVKETMISAQFDDDDDDNKINSKIRKDAMIKGVYCSNKIRFLSPYEGHSMNVKYCLRSWQ